MFLWAFGKKNRQVEALRIKSGTVRSHDIEWSE